MIKTDVRKNEKDDENEGTRVNERYQFTEVINEIWVDKKKNEKDKEMKE